MTPPSPLSPIQPANASLEMLAAGPLSSGDIAGNFTLSPPAISQHLKTLREAHLVRVRAEAQKRIYELDPRGRRRAVRLDSAHPGLLAGEAGRIGRGAAQMNPLGKHHAHQGWRICPHLRTHARQAAAAGMGGTDRSGDPGAVAGEVGRRPSGRREVRHLFFRRQGNHVGCDHASSNATVLSNTPGSKTTLRCPWCAGRSRPRAAPVA